MITDKEVQLSTIDNGYIVECSWREGETFAHDKQYAKTLPKALKMIRNFYHPKNENVIPF